MKRALYFGCIREAGHYLHSADGYISRHKPVPGFPWERTLIDTGLLKNGKIPDCPDGRVFWTCGGKVDLWIAFYWWDRSIDSRPGSNSGFYVEIEIQRPVTLEFVIHHLDEAFEFACKAWPDVVARQKFPLVLQKDWREKS